MEKAEGIEPAEDMGVRKQLERELERVKHGKGYTLDTDLTVEDLQALCDPCHRYQSGLTDLDLLKRGTR